MTDHKYEPIQVSQCDLLERNPQYLTPSQMDALKESIRADGFVVPILVRPRGVDRFEVISGNHRFMAAIELGMEEVPAVIASLDDRAAKRLALNLNLIHGDPLAEQLAPFLAEMDDELLADIHLEDDLRNQIVEFDEELATTLARLEAPKFLDTSSPTSSILKCRCPTCGKDHIAPKS